MDPALINQSTEFFYCTEYASNRNLEKLSFYPADHRLLTGDRL